MMVFKRIIKAGMVGFARNGLVSWAAVLQFINTLTVITLIILLQAVLNFSLEQLKDKVDVTIYFTIDAPEERIMELQDSLEKLPEVLEVTYTSAEEALRIFRERHENDYPTIQALDEIGENPLGAYLNVKTIEVSQYENVANFLKSDDLLSQGGDQIIDKVNYYQNKLVIDRLSSIIAGAKKFSFILMLYLIISSIIITFNTTALTIFISKEEIGVMRLVGASKIRVHGPFMVEGAICGMIASVITIVMFWPITIWFSSHMTNFLGLDMHDYYLSNFVQIFVILLLSGIILGMIASFLAVRRYLVR